MIVSVSLCNGFTNHYIKMKEVETEEEAFYEMRRYLEVNNIYSDVTCRGEKKETDCVGEKGICMEVVMAAEEGALDSVCFAIHYTALPDYLSLDDMKECVEDDGNMFAYYYRQYLESKNTGKIFIGHNSLNVKRIDRKNRKNFYSWTFDEFERYAQDLKQRVGDDQCR